MRKPWLGRTNESGTQSRWIGVSPARFSLPFLAGCTLLLLSLSACLSGAGGDRPIQHQEITGTYPTSDYFLELVSPQARSVIQVDVEDFRRELCEEATVDAIENADCPFEQIFGLKKTGPLATVEEDPAATVYQHEFTIIDGPDELLFLSVGKDKRGPWEKVLEEQGYRRSEVQDVVLWVGPPPWEAFAFIAHGLIVSDTETRMTELLKRRDSRGPSLYDAAGDLWEALGFFGYVRSVERTPQGVIRAISVGTIVPEHLEHYVDAEVGVTMLADYMSPEQAELDIGEWTSEWRGAFPHGCPEPVTNLEDLRYEFKTACRRHVVLHEFLGR